MNKGYYDEYKIANTIIYQQIYLIWEWDESEYCNIIDIENGEFLFDEFYDDDEFTYYKGTLKPILLESITSINLSPLYSFTQTST